MVGSCQFCLFSLRFLSGDSTHCVLCVCILVSLCRLIENFAFMVGSAYFVAGSYPDGAMVIDDDFLDTSIEDGEEGFYLR